MAKSAKKRLIPFILDDKGVFHMQEYTYAHEGEVRTKEENPANPAYPWGRTYSFPTHWVPNEPFEGEMRLNGHWRGRSSARVGVIDINTQTRYSMGFASFYDAVARGQFRLDEDGRPLLVGKWRCSKRGANYILVPLDVA